MAGNHHYGRRVIGLPQRTQQIDAVAVRQAEVEQVEIGAAPGPLCLKLGRRLAHRDTVPLALQNQAQRSADVGLIVDHNHVAGAGHSALSGSWIRANAGRVTLKAAPPS